MSTRHACACYATATYRPAKVRYCPLHKAAPALLAAGRANAVPRINGRCRLCLCEGMAGDHLPECPVPMAEAAIALAEVEA